MDTETYKEVVSVPAIAEHSMSIIRGYLSKSHDSVVRKMNETILERLTKHKNNIDMEQKEDSIQPVSISSLRKGILCGSTNSSLNKLPDMQMTTELLTSLQTPTPETNKKKKVEAKGTSGRGWYNLLSTELTDQIKADFKMLHYRNQADRKRYNTINKKLHIPSFFQVGTVAEDPWHKRVQKRDRRKTMVEQLIADEDVAKNLRKKEQLYLSSLPKRIRRHGERRKKSKPAVI